MEGITAAVNALREQQEAVVAVRFYGGQITRLYDMMHSEQEHVRHLYGNCPSAGDADMEAAIKASRERTAELQSAMQEAVKAKRKAEVIAMGSLGPAKKVDG